MLTVLAFAFVVFAIVRALMNGGGSPRRAFDISRERMRADAHSPAKVAAIYVVLGAFIALNLATDSGNAQSALFESAFVAALVTLMVWVARR